VAVKEIVDIASLEAAIQHATKVFHGARPRWRGHGVENWELKAGVFRNDAGPKRSEPHNEHAIFTLFRDRAATRHTGHPELDDHIGWMFLAQHYGLPTRLLDWTASPLIGLYFAVANGEHDARPGHLYALSPGELNLATTRQDSERFSTLEPFVQQYALDAMGDTREVYDKRLPDAVAISTREIDARMLVQQSTFTLHANAKSLLDIRGNEHFLVGFTIPSASKKEVRDRLAWFGLRPASIFPDLEHLAAELRSAEFLAKPSMRDDQLLRDARSKKGPRNTEAAKATRRTDARL
jgi:hypothetical protein